MTAPAEVDLGRQRVSLGRDVGSRRAEEDLRGLPLVDDVEQLVDRRADRLGRAADDLLQLVDQLFLGVLCLRDESPQVELEGDLGDLAEVGGDGHPLLDRRLGRAAREVQGQDRAQWIGDSRARTGLATAGALARRRRLLRRGFVAREPVGLGILSQDRALTRADTFGRRCGVAAREGDPQSQTLVAQPQLEPAGFALQGVRGAGGGQGGNGGGDQRRKGECEGERPPHIGASSSSDDPVEVVYPRRFSRYQGSPASKWERPL
jgi:hypothetical protein